MSKRQVYWLLIVLVGSGIIFLWLYGFNNDNKVQYASQIAFTDTTLPTSKVLGSRTSSYQNSNPAPISNKTVFQSNSNQPTPPSGQTQITFTDNGFVPREIKVTSGRTIIFRNISTNPLWINSNYYLEHHEGDNCNKEELNSCEQINPGESYMIKLDELGEWIYFDQFSQKKGKIIVEGD